MLKRSKVKELLAMQQTVHDLYADDSILEYIVRLTETTRTPDYFSLGLSPRGSIALLKMARANAFIAGRNYVIPEDIHDIFRPVCIHRVHLNARARAEGEDLPSLLDKVLRQVAIPKVNP